MKRGKFYPHLSPIVPVASIALAAAMASACNEVDDQRQIPAPVARELNPAPVGVSPETNARHEVLIAVVDAGVDFNHPDLKTHFHFEFAPDGAPAASGYDFIGRDAWSYPTLARTEALRPGAPEAVVAEERGWREGIEWVLAQRPEYSRFLSPSRLHKSESKFEIDHGTAVAGLAAYDDDRIGLVPYRVLPFNRESSSDFDYERRFVDNLVDAFGRAEKAGVRVVNLSIGTSFAQDDPNYERLRRYESLFADAVRARPNLVFVAAAGNDAQWVDGQTRFSYPCGIRATNLLCVAALKADGNLADFTNIPLIESPLVFALGADVLSTMPTDFCPSDAVTALDTASEWWMTRQGLAQELANYRKRLLDRLATGCTKIPLYARHDGTSMATPIVSRLIAQLALANPGLSGEALIRKLLDGAARETVGPMPVLKLEAPLPSWYSREDARKRAGKFEFVTTPAHAKTRY